MNQPQREYLTLHELVEQARINLNQNIWDYLVGGTETETTLRRNRQALDAIAFRPRVLRDVAEVDCTASLLGQQLRLPLLLAPIGSLESFGAGGGAAATEAAAAFGVAHMLSSVCNPGLEEVAAAAPSRRIFQALRARRRRLGRRPRAARRRARLFRLLPDRRHRPLQPPRTRPGKTLPQILARAGHRHRIPAGAELGQRQAVSR